MCISFTLGFRFCCVAFVRCCSQNISAHHLSSADRQRLILLNLVSDGTRPLISEEETKVELGSKHLNYFT
jgi:hypothetical protein